MNVEKALRALRENGFEARWFATAAALMRGALESVGLPEDCGEAKSLA